MCSWVRNFWLCVLITHRDLPTVLIVYIAIHGIPVAFFAKLSSRLLRCHVPVHILFLAAIFIGPWNTFLERCRCHSFDTPWTARELGCWKPEREVQHRQ